MKIRRFIKKRRQRTAKRVADQLNGAQVTRTTRAIDQALHRRWLETNSGR